MPTPWAQPLDPLHSTALSALAASVPLVIVLAVMGWLRKSGLAASAWGLGAAAVLAVAVWGMPIDLAVASTAFGVAYALYPILYVVFGALCLYNLTKETGAFDLLRRWMEHRASGDPVVQAILVAFCFGALLESCAGFGAPVAVTAFLLTGLGVPAFRAVLVALVANTAPVAFGSMGIPVVALAGVTGLDVMQLSAMVGRQVPLLSLLVPAYLAWIVGGSAGLRRAWPAALAAGVSFAAAQGLVANLWGPYAADVIASLVSIAATVALLRVWSPSPVGQGFSPAHDTPLSTRDSLVAWFPWVLLSLVIIAWSYFRLPALGAVTVPVPRLHNAVLITLYQKAYAATYNLQPLATGTGVLLAALVTAFGLRAAPAVVLRAAATSFGQLRGPGLTVTLIVGLAYLYNYSGMAYTLGAAAATLGPAFPVASAYLGWVGCFLSGSDTASNLLFGNLQVAAAHQLGVSPVLLAATNSSAGAIGKMISPQNIAVGVTTVALVGQEGRLLRATFWHSVLLAGVMGALAWVQAYWVPWMIP
jgi:lactate permease